ncbi:putative GTP binding protein (modular protein) [Mesorhizobium sp. ORS 3324]|nr:putative GTP binding protein (modular protein) [Mesorhizobium sp. ORS 3324]
MLVVSGEFGANEPLNAFSDAVVSSGARVIVFNSPGGNVGSAIRLGRMIRAAGLDTLQVRQLQCASACSLAFLGGVHRIAEPGSIGVHRASFRPADGMSNEEAQTRIQLGTAAIISYVVEMGVDPKLMELASSYDKQDIRYLSASEMAELHVTNAAANQSAADTSQVSTRPNPAPVPAPEPDDAKQRPESVAVAFVRDLIEHHGDNDDFALAQVQASYAPTVDYYGKLTNLSSIVQDKRNYYQRWPERGYKVRNDSIMVTCANDRCMVSGVYDWVVRSPSIHKQEKGVADFSYTISIGPYPKIIAETGSVQR